MHPTRQTLCLYDTTENRKPNILRKNSDDKNKTAYSIQNPHSSLIPTDFISESVITTQNTFDGDLTPPCDLLLSNVFDDLDEGLNQNVLDYKHSCRKRRPSQKIILDTYICDKSRIAKLQEEEIKKSEIAETQCTLAQNLSPFVPFEISYVVQDDAILEETLFQTVAEQNVPSVISLINTGDAIVNLQAANVAQQNVFCVSQSPMDANVEGEQIFTVFTADGLPEGQISILSSNEGDSKQMWLCPLGTCNAHFSDKEMLDSHILSHIDLNTLMCNLDKCNKIEVNEKPQQTESRVESQNTNAETSKRSEIKVKLGNENKTRNLVTEALISVGITEDMMQASILPDGSKCWCCIQSNCDLAFKTQFLLKDHMLTHHDLRPFKCTHVGCGWAFRSLNKLRAHTEIHCGIRKHICTQPGCWKKFGSKSNLSLHFIKAHAEGGTGLPCPTAGCAETFLDRAQLKEHMAAVHSENKCATCGKKFWQTSRNTSHCLAHVPPPPKLQCAWPDCGRVYSQPSRLKYHQRSHTGDKPYRCTYPNCFWAFTSASKLRRHARTHAGENGRKYPCTNCKSSFLRPEHLKEHIMRHLPQRFMCDYPGCTETFANKSTVYVHKKRDHSGEGRARKAIIRRIESNVLVNTELIEITPVIEEVSVSVEDTLSLRSARTHVPWLGCLQKVLPTEGSISEVPVLDNCNMLHHHTGIEEKQGNPLVCGGLELEGGEEMVGESGVGAELCLGEDVSQQGVDLNINSLLMQEELSEGMLYTTEDDSALHVLLLNEEPPP